MSGLATAPLALSKNTLTLPKLLFVPDVSLSAEV